ncbi:o-succinylbenzoate--CoA ligase [Exiguobacterium alkaliphilum]|uniref:2-succinylbenzoate--CoA ligase n=1 Tax=Exiguobacterium alkaliphilum TaxID=1428684 RepID=A0ABT2KXB0_9BACL|nr:o-succinylbenzoate--CoA ligase [Exiguobacterium alkaliphilum]MCT4794175.1 o-succinylbenzoate--CoA ligase [Exiguobacterium alkaliphilum]
MNALNHPTDHIALVTAGRRLTWGTLWNESARLAHYVKRNAPDARHIGLYAANSAEYVIAVHAVLLLGKVLVPLNTRLTKSEIKTQLETADVDLLLVDETCDVPVPQLTLTMRDDEPISDFHAWKQDEVMSLMFTSGTTGRAKAVKQTYGNHVASAVAAREHLGYGTRDRMLVVTPLFHMSGLAQVYRAACFGSTLYVEPKFDAARTLDLITREHITHVSLVAVMLDRLLAIGLQRQALRVVLVGGGPVPKPLLEEAERRHIPVAQTYGMTETCSQVATLLPSEALDHLGSSGRAILPTRVRINPDGEIEVSGPTVTPGYYKQPEADAWTTDGFWRTGDLGTIQDGYLYVHDRRSDLIISGGENVYPAEIESVLRRCPGIEDAGVTGRLDATWGTVPVAYIVGSYDPLELERLLTEHLASYKHPKAFYSVRELPRNANGKLMRHRLKETAYDSTR